MTKYSHRIFITLVALCMVSGLEQVKESRYKLKNNKKLRGTFNKLLQAVTSVNEERLDALKKFYELQNYLPKVGRTDEKVLAVIIPNKNKINPKRDDNFYKRGTNMEPGGTPALLQVFKGTKDSSDDESLRMIDSEDKTGLLRQWKGCNKSAAKYCIKACKKAFKDVCSDYKCSRSMKKSGKRSCKRHCNKKFSYENDSDSDDY